MGRLRLCILPMLAAFPAPAPAESTSSPLIGTWRLVRYADTPEGSAPIHPFGPNPGGLFIFTADGHAAISIMRNPPGDTAQGTPADPDPDACIPAWYCAYYGTWRLDPAGTSWIVHVEGGNIPSFLGTDQARAFRIEGDRLILSGSYEAEERIVRYERILVRAR